MNVKYSKFPIYREISHSKLQRIFKVLKNLREIKYFQNLQNIALCEVGFQRKNYKTFGNYKQRLIIFVENFSREYFHFLSVRVFSSARSNFFLWEESSSTRGGLIRGSPRRGSGGRSPQTQEKFSKISKKNNKNYNFRQMFPFLIILIEKLAIFQKF